jgi:hypothetical protein
MTAGAVLGVGVGRVAAGVQLPCWQNQHCPQAMVNGTTIRSPFLKFRTALPTSTTSPIGSCPRMSPGFIAGT